MSNVVACGDSIAFHPGCYIEELVQYSGVSQEEYAKRIGITSEELDLLIKGEISLSRNTAVKLANLLGTSVT